MRKALLTPSIFFGLGLGLVFGLDEYLPIDPGTLEVGVGLRHYRVQGYYGPDGKNEKFPDSVNAAFTRAPLSLKYGIMEGLEAGLEIPFVRFNPDWGDVQGIDRPNAALKYHHTSSGLGGLLAVDLPFGSDGIANEPALIFSGGEALAEPSTRIHTGLLYGWEDGNLLFLANATYMYSLKDAEKFKDKDILRIFMLSRYDFLDQLGGYLGLEYSRMLDSQFEGEKNADGGNLFSLFPGIRYEFGNALALDARVPITLSGMLIESTIGFWLTAHFHFALQH